MTRVLTPALLGLASLVLLYIGGSILFAPHAFYAANEISLGTDPNQLSEVRAPAGLLLLSAVIAALGAVRRSLAPAGLLATAAVYGTYGLSRLVGIALAGMPSAGLVTAMGIELVIGVLAVALWVRRPA